MHYEKYSYSSGIYLLVHIKTKSVIYLWNYNNNEKNELNSFIWGFLVNIKNSKFCLDFITTLRQGNNLKWG